MNRRDFLALGVGVTLPSMAVRVQDRWPVLIFYLADPFYAWEERPPLMPDEPHLLAPQVFRRLREWRQDNQRTQYRFYKTAEEAMAAMKTAMFESGKGDGR
jgi:hypothetical protein